MMEDQRSKGVEMQSNETLTRARTWAAALHVDYKGRVQGMSVQVSGDRLMKIAYGHVVTYTGRHGERGVATWLTDFDLGPSRHRDAHRAVYIVDDGASVGAFYVAGHGRDADSDLMLLHEFPKHEGARHPWRLGPRIAYHLLLSGVPALNGAPF